MNQHLSMPGCHMPAMIKSAGGGIARLLLTLVLMLTAMSASAAWYYNLQYNNDTYGWSKSGGNKSYKSGNTFDCPCGAPSLNGKSSSIKISFAGTFKDGYIEYEEYTTIRITAPDGYRIQHIVLDEPNRTGALSSKNYGNYSYSCTEGTGNNQKMDIYSKDAGLKEITLTTNGNNRNFHSRCIKVWIVKEVESWLNFPASYRVAPGKSTSIAKLNDYSGGNGDSYTASTSDAKIATYDAGSNQLNGVNRGTANITVNYAGNDKYATGSKTFLAEVGNTNNLTIPNLNRVDVVVTRNGQTIAPGTPVFDLEQLTYHFTAKNGYTLLGPSVVTRNAYDGFPMPGALRQENGVFLLSNAEDWTNFCYSGVTGSYRMTADISADRNVANQNTFNGTFDGDRHTLTVNYNTNSIGNLAPFCNISDATIRNLRVAGSQYVRTRKYMGGLVGKAFGKQSTIENCEVSTALSYGDKDNCGAGGFVGQANANVNFNNCMFNGSFNSQGTGFSGFVGSCPAVATLHGCYMLASSITVSDSKDNHVFGDRNLKFSSPNYYVDLDRNWAAEPFWTKFSRWQVSSGEAAYICNLKQNFVGENKDIVPHFFLDDSKSVRKGVFSLNGKTAFTSYTNPNQLFPLPDGVEKMSTNMAATGDNMTAEILQKDKDGYYLINNKDDWNLLSYCYNKGDFNGFATNVRLNADINVNTMVGNIIVAYSGIFDGQGHTLTVNYNFNNEERVAPFRTIDGATITNLRTAGTVASNKSPGLASGLVGNTTGNASTISNCESAVALTFTGSGDATNGGLLGRAQAPVAFNSCAFTGSMTAENGYCVGGFVGWAEQHVDINNCLVAANVKVQPATGNSQGNAAFGRNEGQYTITNSYVVKFDNTNINQGNYIDNTQVKNGAMAYVLQNNQAKEYWGQTIGTDDQPILTSNADKHVYKASFQSNNQELAATYANKGNAFPLPGLSGYMPVYDNTPASGDVVIALNQATADGYYTIANRDDWNSFVALYNGTGNYRLIADITDPVTTMVGTDAVPFSGKFDGAGHTLNINLSNDQAFTAPFRYVKGATITDLNVAGKLQQTGTGTNLFHASGLIGRADGATLERCTSSVALTFNGSGDMHSGGLVGHATSSTININDCAFTGSLSEQAGGDNASVGGLVGWGETSCKVNIKNSYVDLTLENIPGLNNFVRANRGWNTNGSTFENCYYTIPDGVRDWDPEPSTKVTTEQIKSGFVANLLQNGYTAADGIVWGQMLTGTSTDARPVITKDNNKRVYKALFTINDNEVLTSFANTGKAFTAPNVRYVSSDPANFSSASADITVALNPFNTDGDGFALINDLTDWNTFATYCNTGNYRLGNNISGITTPAATKQKPFAGKFDGAKHKLTVNFDFSAKTDAEQDDAAPFRAINGATIENVRTAGVITTKKGTSDAGGLVGESTGTVSIDNCESAVDITYNGTGDATNGGLIGRINDNSNVTVDNCAFTGSLKSAQGHSFGGLIGWTHDRNVAVAISNSLVAADIQVQNSNNTTGNAPFARNAGRTTVTNSYYRDFNNIYDGYRKGTKVTDDQLKSGWTTYNLQGSQDGNVWGQKLAGDNADDKPHLSTADAKHVFRALFKYNDQIVDSSYTNSGVAFPVPAMDGYQAFYNGDPASADIDIRLLAKQDGGDIIISDKTDWDYVAANYNGTGNYRLGANIEGITTMLGTKEKPFTGTFDGQGHTMTVSYDAGDQDDVAPFRFISGATIKNLRISGTISGSKLTNDAAGFAGEAIGGNNSFFNCESAVDITFTSRGDASNGGFLGRVNGADNVTFDDCLFSGSFNATNGGYNFGGFVGWADGNKVSISNSLVAPKSISVNGVNGDVRNGNAAFVRNNPNTARVDNSYYVDFSNLYVRQGTEANADELNSGAIAHALQGSQGEQYWGQTIDTDEKPLLTADAAKHVYKATFNIGDIVLYTSYANKEQVFPLSDELAACISNLTAERDSAYQVFNHDTDGFYIINSEAEWNLLSSLADTQGKLNGNYRLGNDISVGTMIKAFTGTFDGAGHTLSVNYNVSDEQNVAPFRIVNGATIKNLRTSGSVVTNMSHGMASGLVGTSEGEPSTISYCESAVDLTFTKYGNPTYGGFMGCAQAQVAINNSAFTGSMTAKDGGNVGGFVGWADKPVTISNSLMTARLDLNENLGFNDNAPFARNNDNVTVNNSYYRIPSPFFIRQGKELYDGDTMLSSGEMAHLLQGTQAEQYWGQTIGTDEMPVFTTDADKHVYEARYMNDTTVMSTTYANIGKVFPKPEINAEATYLTVNEPDDVVATQDQDIDFSGGLTLNLPKSDKYTVEAKCGDKELHDGDAIPATGALVFYLTASLDSIPLNNVEQVMRADGSNRYAIFREPNAYLAAKDGYGLISNKADWDKFARYATAGKFRLTADIDSITTVAGKSSSFPFTGTFDGQGHTLTLDFIESIENQALFRYISGAVIRNLHTAGIITSKEQNAGGIAAVVLESDSSSEFYDCQSSVNMTWTGGNQDMTWGGIIAKAQSDVNIEHCVFDGCIVDNINASNNKGYNIGGFVGQSAKSVSIRNSLLTAKIDISTGKGYWVDNAIFSRGKGVTVENSYWLTDNIDYKNLQITLQGTAISKDGSGITNGYFAYFLQDKREPMYWGQKLGTDEGPVLSSDPDKRVYAADCQLNGVSLMAAYANNGQAFHIPSYIKVDELNNAVASGSDKVITLSNGLNFVLPKSDNYKVTAKLGEKTLADNDLIANTDSLVFALADGDKGKIMGDNTLMMRQAGSNIFADFTPLALAMEDGYALISNRAEWDAFAKYGTAGNYRLTADIDGITTMVGTKEKPFTGTFDGAGHTLTVDYTGPEMPTMEFKALFKYVNNAAFKNLRTAGTIINDMSHYGAAGIASEVSGTVTFDDCVSAVNIYGISFGSTYGVPGIGGLVRRSDGNVTFNNCAFLGSINAPEGYQIGGFTSTIYTAASFNNCLMAGDIVAQRPDNSISYMNTVFGNYSSRYQPVTVTINNCYYREFPGIKDDNLGSYDAKMKFTDEQLKSGDLAHLLQGSQPSLHWGQVIGKDATPVLTSDEAKRVYMADCRLDTVSLLAAYANKGKKFKTPSYIKVDELKNLVASEDVVVKLQKGLTYVQPKSNSYNVAAKLGEASLADGGLIANTDQLTFGLSGTKNTMVLADNELTMRQTGSNIFADFDEPATLKAENGYGLISSLEDWNALAKNSTPGNYRLTADIKGITTMVGTSEKPFSGTFDGAGHKLTVDFDQVRTGAFYVAPFSHTKDIAIKDLRVDGSIKISGQYAGGFIGEAEGKLNIDDCVSAVDMTYTGTKIKSMSAGFVGSNNNFNGTFNNSAFIGSIRSDLASDFSGFMGRGLDGQSTATFNNCLMAAHIALPTIDYASNYPFGRKASDVKNCYYRWFNNMTDGYGATIVNDVQLAGGVIAYLLQGTQAEQHWGQTIDDDDVPQVTADVDKRVIENVYDDNSKFYDNYLVINEAKGNHSLISANDKATANVKLMRKFTEGWNTLVLPFPLTTEEVEAAFGDETKVAYFTNDRANTIELNTKAGTKDIEANTPVLISPSKDPDDIGDCIFAARTVESNDNAIASGSNGINFVGNYDALYTVKDGEYFISGTTLWKSLGNTTIKATRAYFTVPESAAGARIMLIIDGDGTATSIDGVNTDGVTSDDNNIDKRNSGAVYTLAGQKVANSLDEARNLKQGVYIVNGKKVIIK